MKVDKLNIVLIAKEIFLKALDSNPGYLAVENGAKGFEELGEDFKALLEKISMAVRNLKD